MNPSDLFHPTVAKWFADHFAAPTRAQAEAWPAIKAARHTLLAAPTGSARMFAAFLAVIDDLARQGLDGSLPDETQVVNVSLISYQASLYADDGSPHADWICERT